MRSSYLHTASLLIVVVALCASAGCSSYHWPFPTQHSLVDEGWGEAYEHNVAKITANPDAGEVGGPIALDPDTGELVMHRYFESQKAAPGDSALPSLIRIDTAK